jgi:cellobiose-specific phosphotransferase system component IIC
MCVHVQNGLLFGLPIVLVVYSLHLSASTLLMPLCRLFVPVALHVQNGLLFGLPIVLDTNSDDIFPGE